MSQQPGLAIVVFLERGGLVYTFIRQSKKVAAPPIGEHTFALKLSLCHSAKLIRNGFLIIIWLLQLCTSVEKLLCPVHVQSLSCSLGVDAAGELFSRLGCNLMFSVRKLVQTRTTALHGNQAFPLGKTFPVVLAYLHASWKYYSTSFIK